MEGIKLFRAITEEERPVFYTRLWNALNAYVDTLSPEELADFREGLIESSDEDIEESMLSVYQIVIDCFEDFRDTFK